MFKFLLSAVSSINIDTTYFPYSSTNDCAACIVGGGTFCVQGSDNQTISGNTLYPAYSCCQTPDTCPQASNNGYSCSNSFNDTSYALAANCPQRTSFCG